MTFFDIVDAYSADTLATVRARDGLDALSVYCDEQGIARYDWLELDDLAEIVYQYGPAAGHPDRIGLAGACFTNYEIFARPVNLAPFEIVLGQAGYGIRDTRSGVFVEDALEIGYALELARERAGAVV